MPHRLIDPSALPIARDCLECRAPDGMKLQNTGVFSAHYVCRHCGAAYTIPPRELVIRPKHFDDEN